MALFKITITHGQLPKRSDARVLARQVAERVASACSRALVEGYVVNTGEPRRKTADGRTAGYRTGRLAHGIRAKNPTGSASKAVCKVVVPKDREHYVNRDTSASKLAKFAGDVLAVDGRVAPLIVGDLLGYTKDLLP